MCHIQKPKNQLDNFLQEDFWLKQIKQIQQLYHSNDKDLAKYNNNKLIPFLLNRVSSNKDIVSILEYKKVRNRLEKLYKESSMASIRPRDMKLSKSTVEG